MGAGKVDQLFAFEIFFPEGNSLIQISDSLILPGEVELTLSVSQSSRMQSMSSFVTMAIRPALKGCHMEIEAYIRRISW